MVLIIFSNRRVCCGIILVPAPIIMQSNFSRESVSEPTFRFSWKILSSCITYVYRIYIHNDDFLFIERASVLVLAKKEIGKRLGSILIFLNCPLYNYCPIDIIPSIPFIISPPIIGKQIAMFIICCR